MAAINNNPFEYWITTDIVSYNNMMRNMSQVITAPQEPADVTIEEIFTEQMFSELIRDVEQVTRWKNDHIEKVKKIYNDDYKKRKAISEFLKDPLIGKKR